ncbi:hypothetical protein [Streptomyces tardus]|uniref:hypothetical protein n=1 Tax=Streptomyces tardus TaxID=2780544 RepID=UPI001F385C18|nr:hypothetical protein [Streptomyces tardus]
MELEEALHTARALILADLTTADVADAETVSLVEEAVAHRRWWVEQWPEGAKFVPGLVAQDVQDALLDRYGRWPLCPLCGDGAEGHRSGPHPADPHGPGHGAHGAEPTADLYGMPDAQPHADPQPQADPYGGEGPHALDVEPELGEDPHWVCARTATAVAPVGRLRARTEQPGGGT